MVLVAHHDHVNFNIWNLYTCAASCELLFEHETGQLLFAHAPTWLTVYAACRTHLG